MGIKKFIIDTSDLVTLYFSQDDAIDRKQSNIKEYLRDGDASHLKFFPGAKPAEFVVHALDERDERRSMTRAFADKDANGVVGAASIGVAQEAYALGCVELRNIFEDGDKFTPEDVGLAGPVVREIGMHIMRLSGLVVEKEEPKDDLGK